MPFTWNVHPYRWLYQLRENYTQAVFTATRKHAFEQAKEASEWMQANAPWTDRDPDVRRIEDGWIHPSARSGLLAWVDDPNYEADQARAKQAISEAQKADAKLKEMMNKERQAKGKVPLASVPKNKSQERLVVKQIKAQTFPLVSIHFRQDPKLKYTLWLEIAHNQKYSILGPAIEFWGKQFFRDSRRIANLLQYQKTLAPSIEKINHYSLNRSVDQTPTIKKPWSEKIRQQRKIHRAYYKPDRAKELYEARKLLNKAPSRAEIEAYDVRDSSGRIINFHNPKGEF